MPLPNRLAVYLTGAIALIAGLVPLIGNLDWESTAGIVSGLAAVLGVVYKWLDNWGKWERGEGQGLFPGEPEDVFDEEDAEPIPDQMTVDPGDPDYGKGYEPPPRPKDA